MNRLEIESMHLQHCWYVFAYVWRNVILNRGDDRRRSTLFTSSKESNDISCCLCDVVLPANICLCRIALYYNLIEAKRMNEPNRTQTARHLLVCYIFSKKVNEICLYNIIWTTIDFYNSHSNEYEFHSWHIRWRIERILSWFFFYFFCLNVRVNCCCIAPMLRKFHLIHTNNA